MPINKQCFREWCNLFKLKQSFDKYNKSATRISCRDPKPNRSLHYTNNYSPMDEINQAKTSLNGPRDKALKGLKSSNRFIVFEYSRTSRQGRCFTETGFVKVDICILGDGTSKNDKRTWEMIGDDFILALASQN